MVRLHCTGTQNLRMNVYQGQKELEVIVKMPYLGGFFHTPCSNVSHLIKGRSTVEIIIHPTQLT